MPLHYLLPLHFHSGLGSLERSVALFWEQNWFLEYYLRFPAFQMRPWFIFLPRLTEQTLGATFGPTLLFVRIVLVVISWSAASTAFRLSWSFYCAPAVGRLKLCPDFSWRRHRELGFALLLTALSPANLPFSSPYGGVAPQGIHGMGKPRFFEHVCMNRY